MACALEILFHFLLFGIYSQAEQTPNLWNTATVYNSFTVSILLKNWQIKTLLLKVYF